MTWASDGPVVLRPPGKGFTRLGLEFFTREVREVARGLLGCVLVSETSGGRVCLKITETEAYGGASADPGSHAYRSRTLRNDAMFGIGGTAYVYRSYGIHWCLNVVTGVRDEPAAVLIRAGEVIDGSEVARRRRTSGARLVRDRDLARGPGRLCAAMGIAGHHNGIDVTAGGDIGMWEAVGSSATSPEVGISTRTGVSGPGSVLPYRYYLRGDPTVSPHRPVRLKTT